MKTEKEKMMAGELYNSGDVQLTKERDFAKAMCFEFNHTHPSDKERREAILRDMLNVEGAFHIEAPFQCDYGYNIHLGKNFYANFNCLFLDDMAVTIGDNVTIGAGSVVTKDVPSNVFAAGNPCRVIKEI